ncbi:MAG: molybdopterin-dependent oxidoreductase [Pirellulaceae bacterium]|nr:molybdopterin-dependent oxidoreductase [Pirellulaceae bacterium]
MNPSEKNQRLPPGQQLVAPGKWPYVGERGPANSAQPWSLSLVGLVTQPASFLIEDLREFPQTEITTDLHCVTRWSKFDVKFRGVLLKDLLSHAEVQQRAQFVSFVARSDRHHSSSLPLSEALELGVLLATHYEGKALPTEHGGPLRGIVPGRYFYKSVKWIERICLLEEDRPGFWESESGYHNVADPWREQRYIASSVSKREAATIIANRDFRGLDLLSIDVSSLDLRGLQAERAVMRNADFQNTRLSQADFRNANLSNALFQNADLQQACFENADLEGADFSNADLRSANFSGASLFGATFCRLQASGEVTGVAKFDSHTRFDADALEALTAVQQEVVEKCLVRNK